MINLLRSIDHLEINVISYLYNIIERNFNFENTSDTSIILIGERNHDYYSIINNIYKKVGTKIVWSVFKYGKDSDDEFKNLSFISLQQGFIFLMFFSDEKDLDVTQRVIWKLLPKRPWNHSTKFLVLTKNTSNKDSSQLARQLFSIFWHAAGIINLVVIVFTVESELQKTLSILSYEDNTNTNIRAFSWFPYQSGNCRDSRDIQLLSEFSFVNGTQYLDIDFFPSKIPDDFQGCDMTVTPFGIAPYVITTNYTDEEGSEVYDDFGLASESLKVFAERFNITLTYLDPLRSYSNFDFQAIFRTVDYKESDFAVGLLPVLTFTSEFLDLSIPILYEPIKLLIPCPKSIPREKRLVSIFTLAVWLSTGSTFVIVSFVLWMLSTRS